MKSCHKISVSPWLPDIAKRSRRLMNTGEGIAAVATACAAAASSDQDALNLLDFAVAAECDESVVLLPDIPNNEGQDRVTALASAIFTPRDQSEKKLPPQDVSRFRTDENQVYRKPAMSAMVVRSRKIKKPLITHSTKSTSTRRDRGNNFKRKYQEPDEGVEKETDEHHSHHSSTPSTKKMLVSPSPRDIRPDKLNFKPSEAEIENASSPRAMKALASWYSRMNQLFSFRLKHGHTKVPQKYDINKPLGIWVNKQREELKLFESGQKTTLTQTKINHLNSIGFFWGKRKGDFAWNQRFEELEDFREKYGHCNVWTKFKDNRALGRWVSTQRCEYKSLKEGKRSRLDGSKIERLESLGFIWNMAEVKENHHESSPDDSDRIHDQELDAQTSKYDNGDDNTEEGSALGSHSTHIMDPLGYHPVLEIGHTDETSLERIVLFGELEEETAKKVEV